MQSSHSISPTIRQSIEKPEKRVSGRGDVSPRRERDRDRERRGASARAVTSTTEANGIKKNVKPKPREKDRGRERGGDGNGNGNGDTEAEARKEKKRTQRLAAIKKAIEDDSDSGGAPAKPSVSSTLSPLNRPNARKKYDEEGNNLKALRKVERIQKRAAKRPDDLDGDLLAGFEKMDVGDKMDLD